jgi:hypothetical protein
MKEVVTDEDNLLRRVIFTNPNHVRPDQSVTSFAFQPRKIGGVPEMLSVEIERLTTYEASIVDRFNYRLYALSVRTVRQIGLDCVHDPLPENYAHALVTGEISKARSRQMASAAQRIHYPD